MKKINDKKIDDCLWLKLKIKKINVEVRWKKYYRLLYKYAGDKVKHNTFFYCKKCDSYPSFSDN